MPHKKIILAIPPQVGLSKDHLPSIGVGYLAAVLEKNGYEVKIIDSFVEELDNSQTVDLIIKEAPFLLGVSATTHNRFNAMEILNRVKEKSNNEIFTVVGGPHFSLIADQAIVNIPSLDFVVRGEGEETMLRLASQLVEDGGIRTENLAKINGLTFRNNGKPVSNSDREFIKNLDSLPSPAWHLFSINKYNARLEGIIKYRAIGVMSSRGCPQDCVFCVNSAFWKKFFRHHSPKRFVDEIEFLHKKYGFRAFDFWDDTLTIFKPHVIEICNEIIKRNLSIKWYTRARVNTVDFELLSLMKRAGCRAISFGVESGSEKILRIIQKKITIQQVWDAAKACKELDLNTKFFFVHSLPGETKEDFNITLDLIDKLNAYSPNFHCYEGIARIYPGTQLETLAKKEGKLPVDFDWCAKVDFGYVGELGADSTIPLYDNGYLSFEKIIESVKQRKRQRAKKQNLGTLVKKGIKIFFQIRNFSDFKSAIRNFVDLRFKK